MFQFVPGKEWKTRSEVKTLVCRGTVEIHVDTIIVMLQSVLAVGGEFV